MNLWLAYNIVLVLGLVIALAWSYSAHKLAEKGYRGSYEDPPTEEILLPTMVTSSRLDDLELWPPERR